MSDTTTRIAELEAGIREAAAMVDGWHDDTRDRLLALLETRALPAGDITQLSYGCPTIFDFTSGGEPYYFRLRHGTARICHDRTGEELAHGPMPGFDGVRSWDDVVVWAASQGIDLTGDR